MKTEKQAHAGLLTRSILPLYVFCKPINKADFEMHDS